MTWVKIQKAIFLPKPIDVYEYSLLHILQVLVEGSDEMSGYVVVNLPLIALQVKAGWNIKKPFSDANSVSLRECF